MSGKSVLVTGAAGGIGRALCEAFSTAGWRVVATDLDAPEGLPADDFVALDLNRLVIDDDYARAGFTKVAELLNGELHCLVNNAATQRLAPVEDSTSRLWQETMNVNVIAPFQLARAFLQQLEAGRGSIINVSSIHAGATKAGFSAYASSKAALNGLTRALAVELGGRVRVNGIAPAAIETPMLIEGFAKNQGALANLAAYHPAGCVGKPEDLASLALYLATAESGFLTGTIVGFDGGIASRLHDPA